MSAETSLRRFRAVVEGALGALEARRQEVNDLNVFPVADGDTGDNMAMTLQAVISELDRINGQYIDEIGRGEVVDAVARATASTTSPRDRKSTRLNSSHVTTSR